MPESYRIYPDARLVLTTATGTLLGREMLAHALALRADAAFAPDFAQLADFREVTTLAVTTDDILSLAASNPFAATARRVALVGSDAVFGVMRMYQSVAEIDDASSLVTRDEPSAWAFLGLSPADIRGPIASHWISAD